MREHAYCIFGILFITGLFVFLAIVVEPLILEAFPPQLRTNLTMTQSQLRTNLTMTQWLESFELWALVCVGAAAVASFLWYGMGQNVFNANGGKSYGKRGWWGFLFILPVCAVIFSILLIEEAESSLWLAYLCFVVNGLVPYYFATVLFSPVSVKYTPIGGGIRSRLPY